MLNTGQILKKKLGTQLNLTCWFDGIPMPNVTWLVNGSFLDNNLLLSSVGTEENALLLHFPSIKLTDFGIYSCRGYNGFGSVAFSNVTLIVISKQYSII